MGARIGQLLSWVWNRPYLLLSLTALFWSGNLVVGRAASADIPPATFASLRWAGATLITLPFALPHLRRDAPEIRRTLPFLLLLALTGVSLNNATVYLGLRYTEATNALILQSTTPLILALCTYLLYRERLTARQLCGLALSLAGVLTVIARGSLDTLLHLKPNLGDLFVLIAITSYCFYSALLRKRPALHSMSFIGMTFGLGTLMLIPLAIAEFAFGARLHLSVASGLAVLYVAIFPSMVSFIGFNRGVELIGANRAGAFFHLIPPFGAILAMLFLGEQPALYHGIGFALILSGIAFAAGTPRRQAGGEGA